MKDPYLLSDEEVAEAYGQLPLIETYVQGIKDRMQQILTNNGGEALGWKFTHGRKGHRRWEDEAAVQRLIKKFQVPKKDAYVEKLKSPAQLEKLKLGPRRWSQLESYITQSDGRPVIVPADDARPGIAPEVSTDDFADLNEAIEQANREIIL